MGVNILGVGMTRFGRHADRSLTQIAREAAQVALDDAGLTADDVEAVVFANSFEGLLSGQESIRGEVAFVGWGLADCPIVNVENACASGSTAVATAMHGIRAGAYETALVVGAEKLWHEDRARSFAALESATDRSAPPPSVSGRSVFMEHYARKAQTYMEDFGATLEQFASVAVKNSMNSTRNPFAQHQVEHSLAAVLDSRAIAPPLTLYMCSPISDGAAAVVLSSRDAPGSPRLLACNVVSGTGESDPTPLAARTAFEAAGLGPEDVDVAEVHDATAPSEIFAIEDLGLCERGEAASWAATGTSAIGGDLPVNTSGGLLARGHPVGATGVAQLVEASLQLSGRAGARQVPGPRVVVCQNSGGVLGDEVAVAGVTVAAA